MGTDSEADGGGDMNLKPFVTKYYPYGGCRNSQGDLGADKIFTGQRLDRIIPLRCKNARIADSS